MPFTVGMLEADQLYRQSVGRLTSIGFEVSPCRIYKLIYWTNRQLIKHQVGDLAINGELIAAILKSDVGYFVGTYSSNQTSGELPGRHPDY